MQDDYFAGPPTPPQAGEQPGEQARQQPAEPPADAAPLRANEAVEVTAAGGPLGTGLGWLAVGCGAVALLAGWLTPRAWALVAIAFAGVLLTALPTLRRSIDTGAPGRNVSLVALGLGVLGIALVFWELSKDDDRAADPAGLAAAFEAAGAGHLAPGIQLGSLPAIGVAEVDLAGVQGSVAVNCGFRDPVPGIEVGAVGQAVTAGVGVAVGFARGDDGDAIAVVRVGAVTYTLAGPGVVVGSGSDVSISGTFTGDDGSSVDGRVLATCTF